jgi:hypothetical protein
MLLMEAVATLKRRFVSTRLQADSHIYTRQSKNLKSHPQCTVHYVLRPHKQHVGL